MNDSDFFELCKGGSLLQIGDAIRGGANLNARNDDGFTPLMFAAMGNSNHGVIIALIQAGADIEARDNKHGFTPLLRAAGVSPNPEVIRALINGGANVNASAGEFSPLKLASMNPNPEVITTLIAAGAK